MNFIISFFYNIQKSNRKEGYILSFYLFVLQRQIDAILAAALVTSPPAILLV